MKFAHWILTAVVGLFLVAFGALKFTDGAHIFPLIEYKASAIGAPFAELVYPQLNYVVGATEILAGLLTLLPFTRRFGASFAVLPFVGAAAFHLSPLLGVTTPVGYAGGTPPVALPNGGPFAASDFAAETTPVLFALAAGMLVLSLINASLARRFA
ncbi:MAG: hypothetical protein ACFB00_05535 [Parvularculaceae bacterium]